MAGRKKIALADNYTMGQLLDSCYEDEPMIPRPIDVWIQTGISVFDWALGGKGWPTGRYCEMFGPEGCGKTGLALLAIRNAIRIGGCGVLVDGEHSYDGERLLKLGFTNIHINSDGVLVADGLTPRTPHTLEEAHSMIEKAVSHSEHFPAPMIIVWDSFVSKGSRAMVRVQPKNTKTLGGLDASREQIMVEQGINSRWFRKRILSMLNGKPVGLIIINQVRDTMNTYPGSPKTAAPGGRAIKHYASIRIELSTTGKIKAAEGRDSPGKYVQATIVKNRLGPSDRSANFPFYYEHPPDDVQTLIRYAIMKQVIPVTANGRVIYKGQTMLKDALWTWFMENPADLSDFSEICKARYMQKVSTTDMVIEDDEN